MLLLLLTISASSFVCLFAVLLNTPDSSKSVKYISFIEIFAEYCSATLPYLQLMCLRQNLVHNGSCVHNQGKLREQMSSTTRILRRATHLTCKFQMAIMGETSVGYVLILQIRKQQESTTAICVSTLQIFMANIRIIGIAAGITI